GRGGPLMPQTTSEEVASRISARSSRLIALEGGGEEHADGVRQRGAENGRRVPQAVERDQHPVRDAGVELVRGVVGDADVELPPERLRQTGRVLPVPGLRVDRGEDQLE